MPLQWIGDFSVRCNNPVVTERVDASIRSLIPSNILFTGLIYLLNWVSDGAQTFILSNFILLFVSITLPRMTLRQIQVIGTING